MDQTKDSITSFGYFRVEHGKFFIPPKSEGKKYDGMESIPLHFAPLHPILIDPNNWIPLHSISLHQSKQSRKLIFIMFYHLFEHCICKNSILRFSMCSAETFSIFRHQPDIRSSSLVAFLFLTNSIWNVLHVLRSRYKI